MSRVHCLAPLCAGILFLAATALAQPQYQVTEIGPFGRPGLAYVPLKLNGRGDVAGSAWSGGASSDHPFLYTAADGVRDLGLVPDARFGDVWGLNDRGDVLISYYMNDAHTRHFVNSGGAPRELVLPDTYVSTESLDNAGRVVGWYSSASGTRPFVLSGDAFTELPVPAGLQGWAFDSNSAGQVAGARWRVLSIRDGGESVARIWQPDGTVTEIAPPAGWDETAAFAINDRGQVLGKLFNGTLDKPTRSQPFLYRDGVLSELPTPAGWDQLAAGALNNNGDVLGTYTGPGSSRRLFLYSGGQYTDLSQVPLPAGYDTLYPDGINDAGQILIDTFTSGGERHLYLLTPVPEPACAAATLCFVAATVLARRRRRRG